MRPCTHPPLYAKAMPKKASKISMVCCFRCLKKESLTLISVVPIQRVQADDRQLVGNHIDRKVRASLEDVIILCRDKVAPDTVPRR